MFISPCWAVPSHIKAVTTTRRGGVSTKPFDTFNLGDHVGDDHIAVEKNREILKQTLSLPQDPIWLKQTHSNIAIEAHPENQYKEADASFTDKVNQICVVLTADCLPILLCNKEGTSVAAIHAGWRGLMKGVIESTLKSLPSSEWLAWLGPAIGPQHFEVGNEVREQFIDSHPEDTHAFVPSKNQRWLANIYTLAKTRLNKLGILKIYGGNYCTYSDSDAFYSYRRDGEKTGRLASLIWITSPPTVKY